MSVRPVIPPFASLIHQARRYAEQQLSTRGAVRAAYLTSVDCQEGHLPCWQVDVFFTGNARGVTLELHLQPDGTLRICPLAEGNPLPTQERLAAAQRRHAQLQSASGVLWS